MPESLIFLIILLCWALVIAIFWLYWKDLRFLFIKIACKGSKIRFEKDFLISPVLLVIVIFIAGIISVRHLSGSDKQVKPITEDQVTEAVIRGMPKDEREQIIKNYETGIYQNGHIVGHIDKVLISNNHKKVDIVALSESRLLDVTRPFKWRSFVLSADNPDPTLDSLLDIGEDGPRSFTRSNIHCSVLVDDPDVTP